MIPIGIAEAGAFEAVGSEETVLTLMIRFTLEWLTDGRIQWAMEAEITLTIVDVADGVRSTVGGDCAF